MIPIGHLPKTLQLLLQSMKSCYEERLNVEDVLSAFSQHSATCIFIMEVDSYQINWLHNAKQSSASASMLQLPAVNMMDLINKEDLPRFIQDLIHIKQYGMDSFESIYRFVDAQRGHSWSLIRAVPIKFDKYGRLTHTLNFTRQLNHAINNSGFSYQIIREQRKEIIKMLEKRLTAREKDIMVLIGAAKTDQEIADELYISKKTVVSHRRNLLRKLNAKNKLELVRIYNQMSL